MSDRDQIVEDLAEARGDGPHLRVVEPLGEFNGRQPFHDQLAGEVDVHVVVENHHDVRQAELRRRSDLDEPFEPADGLLDRKRDLLLDFDR